MHLLYPRRPFLLPQNPQTPHPRIPASPHPHMPIRHAGEGRGRVGAGGGQVSCIAAYLLVLAPPPLTSSPSIPPPPSSVALCPCISFPVQDTIPIPFLSPYVFEYSTDSRNALVRLTPPPPCNSALSLFCHFRYCAFLLLFLHTKITVQRTHLLLFWRREGGGGGGVTKRDPRKTHSHTHLH